MRETGDVVAVLTAGVGGGRDGHDHGGQQQTGDDLHGGGGVEKYSVCSSFIL